MNRKDLSDKLTLVGSALAANDLVPIFQCFCFDGENVTAYNDALGVVGHCKTPGAFAINGSVLLGLLGASHSELVEFDVDKERVQIQAGKSRFKLPYHPKDNFLFETPELGKGSLQLPIDADLIKGLTACLQTSSTDNAQPAFMGVCLAQGKNGMLLYSTDGDAISRYKLDAPGYKGQNRVLPNSFCQTLIKFVGEIYEKPLERSVGSILVNDEWAAAYLDSSYNIYGRLLVVDDPIDYEKEMVKTRPEAGANAEIPKGLTQALSRARVIADPESAPTKLTVESKKLKLITETPMGVVRDIIKIEHPDSAASVSAQLIHRCVDQCTHMLIRENCVEFWAGDKLYVLTSNMGD